MVQSKSGKYAWHAVLMAMLTLVPAVPAFAARLRIDVRGVRNGNGWLDVCVFDAVEHFPDCRDDRSTIRRQLPAAAGTMRIDVDVAPGRHAVSVLHDENGNGRLDVNFLGMPLEGGGASTNPPPRIGPPRFSDAAFDVPPDGDDIVITMVYP
jgi:uncharacterized protein (DUF2141 family)